MGCTHVPPRVRIFFVCLDVCHCVIPHKIDELEDANRLEKHRPQH